MDNLPDDQKGSSSPIGTLAKEKDIGSSEESWETKKVPIVEFGKTREIEEQEELSELKKEELELEKPVTDDQGQVLVTSPAAQTPKIVLPLLEETYLNPKNWHRPVVEALRWLLEWTKMIIKKYPGGIVFRQGEGK